MLPLVGASSFKKAGISARSMAKMVLRLVVPFFVIPGSMNIDNSGLLAEVNPLVLLTAFG